MSAFRGFAPLRGYLAASLRSAEFGRAADAALTRASPASITDGEDAVGIRAENFQPYRLFARGLTPPVNQGSPLWG